MQNFIIRITQENFNSINNECCQCFILPDTTTPDFALDFVQKAHAKDKLILSEGNNAVEFYKKYNLDGVVVDTSKDEKPQNTVKFVQQQIGKAIVGVISRNRRHEAMLISECEPDFVIFKVWQEGIEHTKELLEWYNELFLIQSAAQVEDKNIDIEALTADFVIIDDTEV